MKVYTAPTKKSDYLAGLDAWRAIMLLIGIFVHTTVVGTHEWFYWIVIASNRFRMEAFFVISGYLSARLIQKRGPKRWWKSRMIALGVPLGTAWFTVVLPAHYVLGHGIGFPAFYWPGRMDRWDFNMHLWFMWILIGCCCFAPAASTGIMHLRRFSDDHEGHRVSRFLDCLHQWPPVLLATTTLAAMALLWLGSRERDVYGVITGSADTGVLSENVLAILVRAPYYSLFYTLGLMLELSQRFKSLFLGCPRPTMVVLILGSLLTLIHHSASFYTPYIDSAMKDWGGKFDSLEKCLIGISSCALIMRHALRVQEIPSWMRRLSEASYTIYLTHMLFIVCLIDPLTSVISSPSAVFSLISLGALLLGWCFHTMVVTRVPVFTFLFNGKVRSSVLARG